MHKYVRHLARFLFVVLIATSASASTVVPTTASKPGEVIVKFRASTSSTQIATIEHSVDVDNGQLLSNVKSGAILLLHSNSLTTSALTSALANDANVEYIEPNYLL